MAERAPDPEDKTNHDCLFVGGMAVFGAITAKEGLLPANPSTDGRDVWALESGQPGTEPASGQSELPDAS